MFFRKFVLLLILVLSSFLNGDVFDRATGFLDAGKMEIWGIENYGLLCGYDHPGSQSWYPGAFHGDWGEVRWIAPVILMPPGPWGAQSTNGPSLPEDRSHQYNTIESFSSIHLSQGDGVNFTDWEAWDNSRSFLHGNEIQDNIPMLATSTYNESWPEGYFDASGRWTNTPGDHHWPGKWALDPDESSPTYGQPLTGEFVSNQDIFFRATDKYNGIRSGAKTAKYGYPVGIDMEVSGYSYSTNLYENIVFFNINFIYRSSDDISNPDSPFYDPNRHYYYGVIDSVYFAFFVDPDLPGRYLKPGSNNYQASPWAEDDYGMVYDYDHDGAIDVFLAYDKQDAFTDENYPQNTGPVSAYGINFFKTPKQDPSNLLSQEIGITGFHWFDQDQAMRPTPVNEDLEKTFYGISSGQPALVPEERRDLWFHSNNPNQDNIDGLVEYQEEYPEGSRPDIQFWFSSGPFSISPGDTIPIHIGIVGGEPVPGSFDVDGFPTNPTDVRFASVFDALGQADSLYQNNFIGFRPPAAPELSAVGTEILDMDGLPVIHGESGKAHLYWDNSSESSYEVITREYDFQGYRIYKTVADLVAVGDIDWGDEIYDYDGNILGYQPLAQYDIVDEWGGSDPLNESFYLGDNSGLEYEFIDTDVSDGVRYRYTITAYDTPNLTSGQNSLESSRGATPRLIQTIDVIPGMQPQGFQPGNIDSNLIRLQGIGTGEISVNVVDELKISGDEYLISFHHDSATGLVSLTVENSTQNIEEILESTEIYQESESSYAKHNIIFDGIGLKVVNHNITEYLDRGWQRINEDSSDYYFTPLFETQDSLARFCDYVVVFGDSTKKVNHPSYPDAAWVPFQIFNTTEDPKRDNPLNLYVRNPNFEWASGDYIYLLEPDFSQRTWQYTVTWSDSSTAPSPGDEYLFRTKKSFTTDQFSLRTHRYQIDETEMDLSQVKVVPNPYIISNITEQRGARSDQFVKNLRFTHLPAHCTIRIFTLRGDHVKTIEHNSSTMGEAVWDLQTKENLIVSYGVYLYLIETDTGHKHTGKFAVVH